MSQDPHKLEGVSRRSQTPARRIPFVGLALFLLAVLGFLILLTPLGGKVKRGLKEVFREPPRASDEPSDDTAGTPGPIAEGEPAVPIDPLSPLAQDPDPQFPAGVLTPPDGVDIRRLSKGINLKVTFESQEGGLASIERKDDEAYVAEYTLKVRVPAPSETIAELEQVNPSLSALVPGLAKMVPEGSVSAWYAQLYANKIERLKAKVGRLDDILTRHNFYDCETMLNLRCKENGRRVFLLQADMDVVSDGSDGDRLATMPEKIVNSTHYQPFTSYRWRKKTETPNPMVAGWKGRIANAKKELAAATTTDARKAWLKERIEMLEAGIADMEYASFLIAEYDPFIVIPLNLVTDRRDPYAPNVGDYAVVIHGKTLYPAIVGDAGPTFKVGEASLRMAKEINANASPYSRPVSDLTVTYLVFPRSGDSPKSAPDYDRWRTRCQELLDEIGGIGEEAQLHNWEDLLAPAVAPESESE